MDIPELELDVERTKVAVEEAQAVLERTNIEARDLSKLRMAEWNHTQAIKRLDKARDDAAKAAAKVDALDVAREAWRVERAPPDLQALVLVHGSWDRISPEAWAKFDADMAEWKRKMREGEFSVYPSK